MAKESKLLIDNERKHLAEHLRGLINRLGSENPPDIFPAETDLEISPEMPDLLETSGHAAV